VRKQRKNRKKNGTLKRNKNKKLQLKKKKKIYKKIKNLIIIINNKIIESTFINHRKKNKKIKEQQ